MHGIVLIDKSAGWTSNHVTRRVQRLCGATSAGHLGTLDPFATGLLPVMLGDATRLAPWLEGGTKVYLAEAALGITTDTLDREGEVQAVRDVPPDFRERLLAALPRFTGTIRQQVPAYSAAKVHGVRRCDLARAGREAEAKFKDVVIHSLRLVEEDVLLLEVACGPGTYVRQLVTDLGEAIGCGAHTASLRRTAVGTFRVEHAVTLEQLESTPPESRGELLVDIRSALPGPLWPAGEAAWAGLSRGRAVRWTESDEPAEGTVVFVAHGGLLRAVAAWSGGLLHPRRVFVSGIPLRSPAGA